MLLHSIRERATGWFAWVIVILISIPFALWGINSYITPDSNPAVANVGEYKITVQEFQNAVQNESQKLKGQVDDALLKQLVLERLVNNRAMINYLSGSGLTISKEQIDQYIRHDESFQVDGQFSEELYNRYLPSPYSKSNYRSSVATQLLLQQFSNGLMQSAVVSDQEVKRVIQLINQKRDVSYAIIKAQDFSDQVSVTEDEINNYYQNFQSRFENPEQVKLSYLEIARKDIAKEISITDEQIAKYYDDNLSQYSEDERRQASHILFSLPADADDKVKDELKAEAQTVLEKIHSGEDFAELAKQYSKDPGSADNGGDLGFFGPGEMVPAFEEATYKLQLNEVSDIVESPFGYHIIKLMAIEGGKTKPLSEVKDKIIESIQFEKAETSYYEKAETLQTMAYEQPDSLDGVATELGLKLMQSEFISRQGGEGIFANSKLIDAAFSEGVLEEGNNSDLIDLGDDHVVVVRIVERLPANIKPLEEVRDSIEQQLKADSLTAKANEKAQEFVSQLNSGKTFAEVADSNSLTVESVGAIDRQAFQVPADILMKAFTMPRDTKFDTVQIRGGDVAIVAVNKIEDGDSGDEALFQSIKTALVQNKGNLYTALSVLQIRSESDIKINKQLLTEEEL